MCVNCFQPCNGTITSDRCVQYTGEDIPLLGIKKGDQLSVVEQKIVEALLDTLDGTSIKPSAVTLGCTFLTDLFGTKEKTLLNLLQLALDANCSLRTLITTVEQKVDSSVSFDVSCLSGLSASPTRDQVLQAALVKLCAVATDVAAIKADYVKASQLSGLIDQHLTQNTGGTVQYYNRMVPNVAYEYYGSLSNFDSTGKGLSAAGFDKVYLCNGLNGTPDRRGRVGVGAVSGVPGAALDSEVDPSLAQNAGTNYTLKQKFGKSFVKLTLSEMPSHTHGVTDPGHAHTTGDQVGISDNANDRNVMVPGGASTGRSVTGISIQSAGSSAAHENRQPSMGAYYIIHLP